MKMVPSDTWDGLLFSARSRLPLAGGGWPVISTSSRLQQCSPSAKAVCCVAASGFDAKIMADRWRSGGADAAPPPPRKMLINISESFPLFFRVISLFYTKAGMTHQDQGFFHWLDRLPFSCPCWLAYWLFRVIRIQAFLDISKKLKQFFLKNQVNVSKLNNSQLQLILSPQNSWIW